MSKQPPNSPCTETDPDARATVCANTTYEIQIRESVPCDGNMLAGVIPSGVTVSQDEDGNKRCFRALARSGGMLSAANWMPGGPSVGSASLASSEAPQYPVPFAPSSFDPAWYALPMDAYFIRGGGWNTIDILQGPKESLNLKHWCMPGVQSCTSLAAQAAQDAADFKNEAPEDMTSPPILCYRGATPAWKFWYDGNPDYPPTRSQWDNKTYVVHITDGGTWYMAPKTAAGQPNVCAAYRMKPLKVDRWTWHYKVMPSSSCASFAAAATDGSNVTDSLGVVGKVADVRCCDGSTTPYCNRPGKELEAFVFCFASMPKDAAADIALYLY